MFDARDGRHDTPAFLRLYVADADQTLALRYVETSLAAAMRQRKA